MERLVTLLIPALVAIILVRTLLLPMRWFCKLALHSACGFACLWMLNGASYITGIAFPINAITVLTAGFLGLPGIAIMALLAVL